MFFAREASKKQIENINVNYKIFVFCALRAQKTNILYFKILIKDRKIKNVPLHESPFFIACIFG